MLQIGVYHTLEILRHVTPGLFLGDEHGNEVLLPNKYMPSEYEIGDRIEVFLYLDFDDREVATTIHPPITLHTFAKLRVVDSNSLGAFLDWGLEKDLFVPFKEQSGKMVPGRSYLVYLYEDESSGRLVASQKVRKFLDNHTLDFKEGDEVDIIIADSSDLGVNVIINQKHAGLIYHDEIFQDLRTGDSLKGFVKKIRPGNKVDISLQKAGYAHIEPSMQVILDKLKSNGGFLSLHDGSDPESIYDQLQMSKKTFKKAIGTLYKNKMILIKENGIELVA